MEPSLFLPISKKDLSERGWTELDIVLVTGDAYVDHPSYGAAVIGRVLEAEGFKVGIIAQPDWRKPDGFMRLGRPRLFFGVTAGNLDSILSHYTVNRKLRHKDAYSPGGKIGLRPNRATIVYANRIRQLFPGVPIILGGLEASLRRLAHYDWWDDSLRRSILVDAKADLLVYGMGESPVTEIAKRLAGGEAVSNLNGIRGTVVIRRELGAFKDAVIIPSFEVVQTSPDKFNQAFAESYREFDPFRGRTICQKHADRFIIQFPPAIPLGTAALDQIYELNYRRTWHPVYQKDGGVPGFETVKFSIISNRGCCGECSFCSLSAHQGRIVQSRSPESILKEVRELAGHKDFNGTITDIGGPTANLYQATCGSWNAKGACPDKHCLLPKKCGSLKLGYEQSINLWREVLKVPGVKHMFIQSGVRYDLLVEPYSDDYLKALCANHISGQLKVAPEHLSERVLKLMNKSSFKVYDQFTQRFQETNRALKKDQYLVNYFISAHPGATTDDAATLSRYLSSRHIHPEQIQDYIPLPMTISACMYFTGRHPFTGEKVYVAKTLKERQTQRAFLQYKMPRNQRLISEAQNDLA